MEDLLTELEASYAEGQRAASPPSTRDPQPDPKPSGTSTWNPAGSPKVYADEPPRTRDPEEPASDADTELLRDLIFGEGANRHDEALDRILAERDRLTGELEQMEADYIVLLTQARSDLDICYAERDRLEGIIRKHHNVTAVHARCGSEAEVREWGRPCEVCREAGYE
jgi:hypothetical protein